MTANNFDWVDTQSVIQMLGIIYNSYCNSHKLYGSKCLLSENTPDEIASCPWEDVKKYFQWVRKVQDMLRFWQSKFTTGNINYELMSYASNSVALNALGRAVCAGSCVMEMDSITQMMDTYRYNFEQLNIYLLRYVPGHPEVKYCTLSSLLSKYGVALPPKVQDIISRHVIYPNDHSKKQKLINVIPPPHNRVFEPGQDIILNLTQEFTLFDLQKLNEELASFLEPFCDSLDMLVFFHLHQSEMFEKHLLKRLQSIVEPDPSQSAKSVMGGGFSLVPSIMSSVIFSRSKERTDKMYQGIPLRSLQAALEGVRDLLMKIVQGTATYSDIIAGGAIKLETINTEKEFSTLRTFSETIKMVNRGNCDGLDGVKSMLELFQFTQHIQTIDAVFEQYGLENCRSDPTLKELLKIMEELRPEGSRAKLTPLDAIIKMKLIKKSLCLQDATSYNKFLNLFSVVAKIKFLDPIIFHQQYQLLTEQLKCDENLLKYLQATLEFLLPFVESHISFKDLMSRVAQFEAKYELKQLDDNITLLRQWLLKAKVIE